MLLTNDRTAVRLHFGTWAALVAQSTEVHKRLAMHYDGRMSGREAPSAVRAAGAEHIVELRGVSLRYGRQWVLQDIDLAFAAGEVVALIGPGGSGKTQLIKTICTLRFPRGEVVLFGDPVSRYNLRLLRATRKRIGLQFQNFALFDYLTVHENVAFSLEHGQGLPTAQRDERVRGALARVDLGDAADRYPSDLSGGMRRRAAIARVIAARPEIAIFDDPVAGLDPVNSAKIMALLSDYGRDCHSLVIIATHDLQRLLPITNRAVALFEGRVRYDGPTAELTRCPDADVRNFVASATEEWAGNAEVGR